MDWTCEFTMAEKTILKFHKLSIVFLGIQILENATVYPSTNKWTLFNRSPGFFSPFAMKNDCFPCNSDTATVLGIMQSACNHPMELFELLIGVINPRRPIQTATVSMLEVCVCWNKCCVRLQFWQENGVGAEDGGASQQEQATTQYVIF